MNADDAVLWLIFWQIEKAQANHNHRFCNNLPKAHFPRNDR
jgi:hypothetical protein